MSALGCSWLGFALIFASGSALAAPDFDGDGAADAVDGAPCDGEALAWSEVPARETWGTLWFDAGPDLDFAQGRLFWHVALAHDGEGVRAAELSIRGVELASGVTLHWRAPNLAVAQLEADIDGTPTSFQVSLRTK